MLIWIIAGIAVYYVGVFIPATLALVNSGLGWGAGPRDTPPEPSVLLGRAHRAHENFKENLPVFLALAILNMLPGGEAPQLAITGAATVVLARIVYIPVYLAGISWLRTMVFAVGALGLVMMIVALF